MLTRKNSAGAFAEKVSPAPGAYSVGISAVVLRLGALWRRLKRNEVFFEERSRALLGSVLGPEEDLPLPGLDRVRKYWELSLHFVCNSLYEAKGLVLSRQEEERILLLSLLSPFYDDLFEEGGDAERIRALTAQPEAFQAVSRNEKVVRGLYIELLSGLDDPAGFKTRFLEVFSWQRRSLRQQDPGIPEAELFEITWGKSYHSFLLFFALLDHAPSETELDMIFRVSGLLQFTNDVFDVYKDLHNGVYTIPVLYGNFTRLRRWFLEEISVLNGQLSVLPYKTARKKKLAVTFHAMNAMCLVALEQLEENTGGAAGPEQLRSMSRKELVCDMDLLSGKIRWLQRVKFLCNVRV